MAKNTDEKLENIKKKQADARRKLRELNQQEKVLQLQKDNDNYRQIIGIAYAAINVFKERVPRKQHDAERFFKSLINNNQSNFNKQQN